MTARILITNSCANASYEDHYDATSPAQGNSRAIQMPCTQSHATSSISGKVPWVEKRSCMTIERKSESAGESAKPSSSSHQSTPNQTLRMLPTPNEMVEAMSRRVIGQEEAKRTLAVAVYHHLLACAKSDLHGGRVEAENHVLLIGPTGSGKSLLLKTLGEILPFASTFYIPCTAITPDGYKGKNLAQHLESVSDKLEDKGHTTPGIVVWDEVDKLSLTSFGENESVEHASLFRRMVQTEFLSYLDGSKWGDCKMDASRILNIGIGAFVGLDKIRDTSAKPSLGFHSPHHQPTPSLDPIRPEHLIRYGLVPEFVGRFSRIACLERLDRNSMRRILLEAEDNVLDRRKDFFSLHGIQLEISDDALDELVSRALKHETGARALRLEVDQVLRPVEHRLPDMSAAGMDSLLIDRDVVTGHSPIIECRGKRKNLSMLLEIRRHAVGGKSEETSEGESDDLCIF